ncbi:histidine kinase [Empedobacter brevis]|uniref:sensor histidine kinase n=1 Tax=Empedobacter brevis TaxID=247 RepID=UPI0023F4A129|nr:histidine kinase [Empedobacter brevis]
MLFRKSILFIVFIFCSNWLDGQFVLTKQYTYENGLPANEILSIYKDSRKFLWVGTRYGIFVKDMNHFRMLKSFEKEQYNNIWTIIEDKQHNIWFGSYGQGVLKFTGQDFEQVNTAKGLVSDRVRNLFYLNDLIYVATQGGVSIIDTKSKKIDNPAFEKNNNIVFEAVSFFEHKNKVYVTTIDHGIYEVTPSKLKLIQPFDKINYSFVYGKNLYFSSSRGLREIPINDFFNHQSNFITYDLPIFRNHHFSPKRNSLLIVGNDIGAGNGMVAEIKNNQITDQTETFKILSDYPYRIFSSKTDDLIYVGSTDKGLFEVHFNHFLDFSTIDHKRVIEILKIGNVQYFLTPEGLYFKENNELRKVIKKESFYNYMRQNKAKFKDFLGRANKDFYEIDFELQAKNLRFYKIVIHHNSFIIATNFGLFELDFEGNFRNYLPNRINQFTYFKDQFIQTTPFGGILIFNDLKTLKYRSYSAAQGNVPKDVVSISQNKNAVFFGSSLDGLFKYENGKFISYLQNNQFNESKLKMIKCIGDNQLMVATEFAKVYILEINGDELITKKIIDIRAIGAENISSIDIFGTSILIGTNRNLLVFNQNKMYMLSNEQGFVNKDIHSSVFDGKIVTLGVENGYYRLNLDNLLHQPNYSKKVIITGLKVNDSVFGIEKFSWFDLIDKNLKLKNSENNIVLNFSIVDANFSENYKYRYRVNPDENWSDYFNEETLFLRNLQYGKYKIQLEITDTNNGEKQLVDLLSLEIDEPFYLNIYFILLSILTCGLIIYRYNTNKIKTLKKFNQLKINQLNERNQQENKRLQLERQLTETRLTALQSQMNPHFIFNVLNSIQFYILDNDIDNALNSLGRFSHLIRQMLNLSTKDEISLNDEIDFLKLYVEVENFRWRNKVLFEIDVDAQLDIYRIKIPPMLIQPIIENAFVHAFDQNHPHPKVNLSFCLKKNYLELTIEDNGKGSTNKRTNNRLYESKALKIINERLQLLNQNSGDNIFIDFHERGTAVRMLLRIL